MRPQRGFWALLGSQLGSKAAQMVANHPEGLGSPLIDRIAVVGESLTNSGASFHLYLLFHVAASSPSSPSSPSPSLPPPPHPPPSLKDNPPHVGSSPGRKPTASRGGREAGS